ncbi:hypothetical protein BgiMline_021748 [Biomphalaria glabrata]|nr:hypothetical protein BgiMline_028326 [Biomphalaria glabrata]
MNPYVDHKSKRISKTNKSGSKADDLKIQRNLVAQEPLNMNHNRHDKSFPPNLLQASRRSQPAPIPATTWNRNPSQTTMSRNLAPLPPIGYAQQRVDGTRRRCEDLVLQMIREFGLGK